MSPLSWTPVKQGAIYCSPACGASCKLAEYDRVKTLARTVAKKMGKGWEISLHENMGWFGSVKSPDGLWTIHVPDRYQPRYEAKFGGDPYTTLPIGRMGAVISWSAVGETPEAAVQRLIEVAKPDIEKIHNVIGAFDEALRIRVPREGK